jgi:hypothetical protein
MSSDAPCDPGTSTADVWRALLEPVVARCRGFVKAAEPWSLTSLREKLIKIDAKVVSYGRFVRVPDGRGSPYCDRYLPKS